MELYYTTNRTVIYRSVLNEQIRWYLTILQSAWQSDLHLLVPVQYIPTVITGHQWNALLRARN